MMPDSDRLKQWLTPKNLLAVGLLALFAILTTTAAYFVLPYHSDWGDCFRPASLALWSAQRETYQQVIVTCNMSHGPWLVAALLPVAILPAQLSRAIFFMVSIVGYTFVMVKLGAKPIAVIAFLLSYPVVYGLIYGQIDWLAMLGFILPPSVGIILILAKPQVGIGVVIYWLVEVWRAERWRGIVKVTVPTLIVAAITYLIVGNWLANLGGSSIWVPIPLPQNVTFWPRSLPFGLAFLVYAIRERKKNMAMIASPLLAPYVAVHSWASGLLGLAPDTLLCVIACIATWVVWLIGGGAPDG